MAAPSPAAVGEADRQIPVSPANRSDHDERHFTLRVATNFALKIGKALGGFATTEIIAPPFGGEPCELNRLAGGRGDSREKNERER